MYHVIPPGYALGRRVSGIIRGGCIKIKKNTEATLKTSVFAVLFLRHHQLGRKVHVGVLRAFITRTRNAWLRRLIAHKGIQDQTAPQIKTAPKEQVIMVSSVRVGDLKKKEKTVSRWLK